MHINLMVQQLYRLPQNMQFNLSVLTISAWVNTSRYDNAVSDQGDTQQVITSNQGYSGWGVVEFKTGGYNVGQSDQFLRSGLVGRLDPMAGLIREK